MFLGQPLINLLYFHLLDLSVSRYQLSVSVVLKVAKTGIRPLRYTAHTRKYTIKVTCASFQDIWLRNFGDDNVSYATAQF